MRSSATFRGQPLLVLSLVLVGWVGMRVMTWQSPITYPASLAGFAKGTIVNQVATKSDEERLSSANVGSVQAHSLTKASETDQSEQTSDLRERALLPTTTTGPNAEDYWEPAPLPPEPEIAPVPHWQGSVLQSSPVAPADTPKDSLPVPTKIAAGHQILMAAAFSQMEIPAEMQQALSQAIAAKSPAKEARKFAPRSKPQPEVATARATVERWSIDGWLLLRSDDTTSLAAVEPSYGRSQAGAVLRFNLDPSSEFKPQVYARATGALEGGEEIDFAGGISAKLDKKIPLRFAAEMRASRQGGAWEARPAAFAITELPEAKLPFELRGEAYAQAGYVGGDFATAFVDGQLRVDRRLTEIGQGKLRIGAASWGGAQKDAARLDIGPMASISFKLGEGRAKLSADYRLRVAGDAQPDSGPAVTLTAGF